MSPDAVRRRPAMSPVLSRPDESWSPETLPLAVGCTLPAGVNLPLVGQSMLRGKAMVVRMTAFSLLIILIRLRACHVRLARTSRYALQCHEDKSREESCVAHPAGALIVRAFQLTARAGQPGCTQRDGFFMRSRGSDRHEHESAQLC